VVFEDQIEPKFKTEVRVLQESTLSMTELRVSGNRNIFTELQSKKNYCVDEICSEIIVSQKLRSENIDCKVLCSQNSTPPISDQFTQKCKRRKITISNIFSTYKVKTRA
jgi:hypothetical protein